MSIVDPVAAAALTSSSPQVGNATLVNGTVTVALAGVTTASEIIVTPKTPIGTLGASYKAVAGTGQFTITSVATGLGTQALDNSVLQYVVII